MSANKTVGEDQKSKRSSAQVATEVSAEEIEVEEDEEELTSDRGITPGKGYATPSRRRQQEEVEEKASLPVRVIGGLREYFQGVRSELDKVVWPTREEAQRLTVIVLVTLVIASLVLGSISLFFTELFRVGLNSPIILLAVMLIGCVGGYFFIRAMYRRTSY